MKFVKLRASGRMEIKYNTIQRQEHSRFSTIGKKISVHRRLFYTFYSVLKMNAMRSSPCKARKQH